MDKWNEVRLGEICEINPTKKQSMGAYENMEISFVPMTDVTEDGKIFTSNRRAYSEVSSGFTHFKENDVLFAKITPCMENGKGAIARGLINGLGVGSTEFHVLRPNVKLVLSEWIFRLTSYSKFRKSAEKNMTGSAGQKRVPKSFLENVVIPLPPLETQKQIAKTLDTVAELLDMRKQQLAELNSLIKSVFYNMFGDVLINSKKWKVSKGNNIFTFSSGKFNPTSNLNDSYEYPCYGGNGITGKSKEYLIDFKTIVIGRVGVYCGSVHVTESKSWITDNAIYLKKYDETMYNLLNFRRTKISLRADAVWV